MLLLLGWVACVCLLPIKCQPEYSLLVLEVSNIKIKNDLTVVFLLAVACDEYRLVNKFTVGKSDGNISVVANNNDYWFYFKKNVIWKTTLFEILISKPKCKELLMTM